MPIHEPVSDRWSPRVTKYSGNRVAPQVLIGFGVSPRFISAFSSTTETPHYARVFHLPSEPELRKTSEDFVLQGLNPATGRKLYSQLFGSVPQAFLRRSHWLLEPDGPRHDVPFAALVAEARDGVPVYLIERAAAQLIPGAPLLQKRPFDGDGTFVGVGDPCRSWGPRLQRCGQSFSGGKAQV